jgi:tetratricopeptide (TPR) repeat protein
LLLSSNATAAFAVADEALAIDPQSAPGLALTGIAHLALGDAPRAVDLLRRATVQAPDGPYHRDLGNALMAAQKWDEAERSLRRALEVDPSDVAAMILLGRLDLRGGRIDEALERAATAEGLDPKNAEASLLGGNALWAQGRLEDAAAAFERSLAVRSSTEAALLLYRVRLDGDPTGAVRALEERLEAAPGDTRIRLAAADAYQQGGQASLAIDQYQRILDREPENPIAWNNVAWLYYLEADPRAIEAARKAHELRPQDGAILDTLGWLLAESGELNDSLPLLRSAAALLPRDGEVRYHLAAVLARRGDDQEARSVVRSLLASDLVFASRQKAQQLLQTLESRI